MQELQTVNLDGQVGAGTNGILGALIITGQLDLDAEIGVRAGAAGAASLTVSLTSNIGEDVNTTGIQTYTGAVTFWRCGYTI